MDLEPGWWGMSPGHILEYFCLWKRPQRPHFEPQNSNFRHFRPHYWKSHFWLFVPNPLFESRIFKSVLYKMFLWTVRTILVFTKKSPGYGKTLPKKRILGNMFFEISVKKCKFIGEKFCFLWRCVYIPVYIYPSILKSFGLRSTSGLRRLFLFLKNDISGFFGHAYFWKNEFS